MVSHPPAQDQFNHSQVTYPLDTLRLRLAVDPNIKTVASGTAALYREGGLAAFFRGVGPASMGIAPYMALELTAFDLLPREMSSFSRGFTGALIATSFCYPLDTIRFVAIYKSMLSSPRSIRPVFMLSIAVGFRNGLQAIDPIREQKWVSSGSSNKPHFT